ncbi:MAG: hypothetical protein C0508_23825 [Cyanobacteria bacterium PR.023]|nr:hypothetical protein [Cyanobacteria bacterium PR.023]MDQ5937050.1 hypothetical protein [Cyanobacteriota bacterium erpe_2018_sw_21hr_WHONDRS-SW48-000092_B_bin.40]
MVVAFLLLLAPLHVSLVQAAPGPASPATLPMAKTKLERPRFTPSDVNGRSSYLDESDVSSIFDSAEILAEDKKWSQAIALWDKLLKKHPLPRTCLASLAGFTSMWLSSTSLACLGEAR